MNRRHFLQSSALAASAVSPNAAAETSQPILSGIQIGAVSMLDEGIERCLDFVQEHAAVNTLFLYTQSYHMGTRPKNVLADDHPVPPRGVAGRKLHLFEHRLARRRAGIRDS